MFLDKALQNSSIDECYVFGRTSTGKTHPKLTEIINQNFLNELEVNFPLVDVVICCLGTTIKKAGSEKSFYNTDVEIPLKIADLAIKHAVKHFIIQSSVGANSKSGNFYLKCKGELEDALINKKFESLVIARPSVLLGARKEFRLGELLSKSAMKLFSWTLIGSMRKYKAIKALDVAKAMLELSIHQPQGVKILEYDEIQNISRFS